VLMGFRPCTATTVKVLRPEHTAISRRVKGDRHMPALRHLLNRMLGQLHHCLQHHEIFDDSHAYPETARTL
jgi:hypothetical protein